MGGTAPSAAVRMFNECQLLQKLNKAFNWSLSFDELRKQKAGTVAFWREYLAMTSPMVDSNG